MSLPASAECNNTAKYSEHVRDSDHGLLAPFIDPSPHERQLEPRLREKVATDEYTKVIGLKFEPNGRGMHFPGNTIICHISPEGALYRTLSVVYNELVNKDFIHLYTVLPPASWHMTVFEGVCDQVRISGFWPDDMPLDTPLANCNAVFRKKLANFDTGIEPPIRMAVEGWEALTDGIAVRLVPDSPAEEVRIRRLRDRLSELLGIRHPIHDTYVFHVSVAYLLRHLNKQKSMDIWTFLQAHRPELPEFFDLGVPEFCLFDDVFAYHRQCFLERQN